VTVITIFLDDSPIFLSYEIDINHRVPSHPPAKLETGCRSGTSTVKENVELTNMLACQPEKGHQIVALDHIRAPVGDLDELYSARESP
jgi:hypothetical protein